VYAGGIRGPVSVFHTERISPLKRSRNGTNLQNAVKIQPCPKPKAVFLKKPEKSTPTPFLVNKGNYLDSLERRFYTERG
jgi:hypothetical protein